MKYLAVVGTENANVMELPASMRANPSPKNKVNQKTHKKDT